MQADNWISLVAAAAAVAAAVVAVWHGRLARSQAATAQRSAAAAEQQAELMGRQLEAGRAERDERDGPVFTCTPQGRTGSICKIVIAMESGPEEVTVQVPEIRVRPEGHDPSDTGSVLPADSHEYRVVPGGDFSVDVDLRADDGPVVIELRLESAELSERGRLWTVVGPSVPAPPASPVIAR